MLKLSHKLPRSIFVAVSGGIDSVVALDFLANNHNVSIAHLNHNEGNSDESSEFVHTLADRYNCPLFYKKITDSKPAGVSREEFWRNERYAFFHSINAQVVTAHTLDDCVETWLWSSLHGTGKIIPFSNKNVLRPFILTTKSAITYWANSRELTWIEDESNKDCTLTRNYIRKHVMPHALAVNPGLYKTIQKKVKANV